MLGVLAKVFHPFLSLPMLTSCFSNLGVSPSTSVNGESGLDEKYSDSERLKRYLSASAEEAEVGVDADADVDDDALEDGVDDVDLYVFVSFCVSLDRPACEWNCC